MKSVPVYVNVTNTELETRVNKVKDLLRATEMETAFISSKGPMLYGVSAPDDDILTVGEIVVCGVSSLSEDQKSQLNTFLQALLGHS